MWDGVAGVKERTSGVNTFASTIYDMSAQNNDGIQATEANQPYTAGQIAPNETRKLKNVIEEDRKLTFTNVQFTNAQPYSFTFAVNRNMRGSTSDVQSVFGYNIAPWNWIGLTNTGVQLRNSSGAQYEFNNSFVNSDYGRTIIYTLCNIGNGNIVLYKNGVYFGGLAADAALISNQLLIHATNVTRSFNGSLHHASIHNTALSASEIQSMHAYLATIHPDIEGIAIGNQFIASSNYEGVVAGDGTVIPEVQSATNTETITNGTFTGGASQFTLTNAVWQAGAGDGEILMTKAAGVNSVISQGSKTYTSGQVLRFRINIVSNPANRKIQTGAFSGSEAFTLGYTLGDGTGVKEMSIPATRSGTSALLYLETTSATGDQVVIDDFSVEVVGWAALTTPAWCYYNNSAANGAVYGKLYNWYAVDLIAKYPPLGWHVPTSAEFTQLQTYLGGSTVAGGKMKKEGLTYWTTPNTGADNSSGFTGLGGGFTSNLGVEQQFNALNRFWCADGVGLSVVLSATNASLNISTALDVRYGFYIRLIKTT
jgi:uncharacterized protein (TIGR02145 family)